MMRSRPVKCIVLRGGEGAFEREGGEVGDGCAVDCDGERLRTQARAVQTGQMVADMYCIMYSR